MSPSPATASAARLEVARAVREPSDEPPAMTFQAILVFSIGFFLAYVNGANDVSKGIATLVGSGVADYRGAIVWGTAWTAIGGLFGALFAGALIATFGN